MLYFTKQNTIKINTRLLLNTNSIKLHQPITHCIKYERKKYRSLSSIRWKLPTRNTKISICIFKLKLKSLINQ